MSRAPEFISLSDAAVRAVAGANSRHAALIEDAFGVLMETPGGGVSLNGDARARDCAFLAALAAGKREQAARGEACGLIGILALMEIAARLGWSARVLDYRNSGDTCGGRDQVVGYGAAVFCAPGAA